MRTQGTFFEQIAKEYLLNSHLALETENFNCKLGEIDLVMTDGNTMVFVEVKQRANNHYGGALAAVTPKKQQRIIKSAMFYCQTKNINFEQQACRFDVVAITGGSPPYQIQWVKNAFPN
mgnify:CR=1 FL=1